MATEFSKVDRPRFLGQALRLSYLSVGWGLTSGTWAIVAGALAGSLGVLGVGLNVMADVAGSVSLVWRFRVEQHSPHHSDRAERQASLVVAAALAAAALFLTVQSARHLATHTGPQESISAVLAAAVAAAVLTPLGLAKRGVGRALGSRALRGDGTLSLLGAGLAILALVGLVLVHTVGWWWADPAVALVVALVAALECWRVLSERPPQE